MGKFEINKDKAGKFRFNLKARNHPIIGSSEMYSSTSAMSKGIASIKKNAPKAKVQDNS